MSRTPSRRAVAAPVVAFLLVLAAALPAAAAEDQFFKLQFAKKNSSLFTSDRDYVLDRNFADWTSGILTKPNGDTNVRAAIFLFNSCYGGGMLDDLSDRGTGRRWVGGSASLHSEKAWGALDAAANPLPFWTQALLPEMPKDQVFIRSINAARANDSRGINGNKSEEGQSVFANGGDTIKLVDAGATQRHAILWAGYPDATRHFNAIRDMRAALIAAWGPLGDNTSITILFGDGTHTRMNGADDLPAAWDAAEATAATLKDTIDGLKDSMGADSEFFFFATDHGSIKTQTLPEPKLIIPGANDVRQARLFPGEIQGMSLTPDNVPTVAISYENLLGGSATVSFNGHLLGLLTPSAATNTIHFPVDESWLNGLTLDAGELVSVNSIEVSATGSSFDMLTQDFFLGGIADSDVVPEPAAGCLVGFLGVLFAARRRRR
jgi:hypothetical protein